MVARTNITCRHCGFAVPADAPVCPGCRRPVIQGWHRRARELAAVERKARRARPPLHDDGYRSLLRRASVARSALWASASAAVVVAAFHVAWLGRLDDPVVTVAATEVRIDEVATRATVGLLVLLTVTGLAFIAWAVRAYRNLPALGIRERRYWTIWLVIGWIIPGANLLVPKLLVDDIWRASSPRVPVDGGPGWQHRPVASVVNRWWCSFLVTPAVVVLAAVTARGGLDAFEDQLAVGALVVAATAALVVAAIAARVLIAVVTVAQARRADVIVDLRADERLAHDHLLAVERSRW